MKKILLLTLIASPALADATIGGQTVDCYCTDKTGSRMELGEMTCLHVDGQMFMAQCQMSLNVPMWRKISDGCLSSALPQSLQPAIDTGRVDS
ncbi:hypothetical protein G5B38_00670 [Pseudohalocynthiibacter aestuariivivens]|uniref:Uncharacterized protein n=1 Tax=Roseovarius pelagicus TaxID=2980108 RepID=A0ABY6DCR5_9RHOB|nr:MULTISPECIES: hypothetical protein [Rhodobacterales]QIE44158.1 hypothetical protein G5B38_00670 [Pseudohalocynthiibacter aestuariivivens]UXX83939.1 hypothetical protein N7U68_04590 [Roseovarius pelagicus]